MLYANFNVPRTVMIVCVVIIINDIHEKLRM